MKREKKIYAWLSESKFAVKMLEKTNFINQYNFGCRGQAFHAYTCSERSQFF